MASVNTNAAAITALRTLQNTNASMDKTQNRISTGYKIGEAKDNAAYWAISTTLKSDNKSLATVKDALGLGASTVDTAYQGLNKAKDVLDEIKSKLTAATQDGVDRDTIQNEITQLQDQLKSIATSSVFSGENWLSTDTSAVSYNANKQVVASFSRDASGAVNIGTIGVDISKVALFDASTAAGTGGIVDGAINLKGKDGRDLTIGGTAVTTGNNVTAGLTAAAGTTTGAVAGAASATVVGAAAGTTALAATGADGATPYATSSYDSVTEANGSPSNGDLITVQLAAGITTTFNRGASAPSLLEIASAINSASNMNTLVTADATSGKLVITNKTKGSTGYTLTVTSGAASVTETLAATSGFPKTSTATAATKTAAAAIDVNGMAAGDVMTITYRVDSNTVRTATVTVPASPTPTNVGSAIAGTTFAGGMTVTSSTGTLTFTSGTKGAGSSISIDDITVKSSTGVIKNLSPENGDLVASKAASNTTNDVNSGYATNFVATDKMTFNFAVDGTTLDPVTVDAGANLAGLVNNLNGNATFSAKATASVDATSNKLVITSKTVGAASAVTVNSVAFTDVNGASKNVANSGFVNVATAATATTAAFTSAVTLDDDDNLYFKVQVDQATAPTNVTINKALVNKALTAAAQLANPSAAAITNGKITSATDFQKVVDAALVEVGVKGVTTSVNGSNQLVFTSSSVGTSAKLIVSDVVASQGGNKIALSDMDISATGLAKVGATTSDQIKQVLTAYIDAVNTAITKVTSAAASLGSVASRIDLQKSFVDTLMDTIDKGVGNLIDADMSEESTKLQALQVKQQLGVQALSIANQASQSILSLFRS